ncbi:hypothetical protein [Streptomyces abyssalis]|uniref:hypothetical protein n=1 Tax=Streptomyces abyssalis TaxID=933944 RepID=UPI0009A09A9E|nr:hypothetical protein [Streptomyces abyssalis]
MPAEDRARKPGAPPSAPGEQGVSMRALLASCAAADAVSTPPSDVDGSPSEAGRAKRGDDEAGTATMTGAAEAHPGQDAA